MESVDELAEEVIAGKWGSGDARKTALEKAGYDYSSVQKRVNEMLTGGSSKKSVTEIAKEVLCLKDKKRYRSVYERIDLYAILRDFSRKIWRWQGKHGIICPLPPPTMARKGGACMDYLISLIIADVAGVICHLISKWLDGDK